MAVAAASLAISMLSISAGLILANALPAAFDPAKSPVVTGVPSTIINGEELKEIEFVPRMRKTGGAFNTPLGIVICTPAERPARACSKL